MGGALKDSLLIVITELLCCSEEVLISERAGKRAKDTCASGHLDWVRSTSSIW